MQRYIRVAYMKTKKLDKTEKERGGGCVRGLAEVQEKEGRKAGC